MKKQDAYTSRLSFPAEMSGKTIPGYPIYPPSEDIYNTNKEEGELDPEDISRTKPKNEDESMGKHNEKDSHDDPMGGDLDVAGSEMDDDMETIGSEDEENNYYSLGGDNHNDLDEDKGE